MSKIALISCTKSKKDYPCPVNELYSESQLFRLRYKYAKLFCDDIFILSSKYGLLHESDVIGPYELTLKDKPNSYKLEWSNFVLEGLKLYTNIEKDQFIILAGYDYYAGYQSFLRKYVIPYEGQKYGERMKSISFAISDYSKQKNCNTEQRKEHITREIPLKEQIDNVIQELLDQSKAKGMIFVELIAREIAKTLGVKDRFPSICAGMRRNMKGNDAIVYQTASGNSSTLKIRYYLDKR